MKAFGNNRSLSIIDIKKEYEVDYAFYAIVYKFSRIKAAAEISAPAQLTTGIN